MTDLLGRPAGAWETGPAQTLRVGRGIVRCEQQAFIPVPTFHDEDASPHSGSYIPNFPENGGSAPASKPLCLSWQTAHTCESAHQRLRPPLAAHVHYAVVRQKIR